MQRLRFKIGLLFLLAWSVIQPAKASHIVGGEVSYKCLGNNNYEITVSIYEDCVTGDPKAIAEDNPGYIAIYTGPALRQRYLADTINISPRITVPANFSN